MMFTDLESGSEVICMGVTTQRSSILMWDLATGEALTPIISWKDCGSQDLVDRMNRHPLIKLYKWYSWFMYVITRKGNYKSYSELEFSAKHVSLKLKKVLAENEEVKARLAEGRKVVYGTLETWLVYKLTGKRVYATELGYASTTALFDPYTKTWNKSLLNFLQIDPAVLPPFRPSVGHWGDTDPREIGFCVPITAVVGDQGASLAGSQCQSPGYCKVTLGTMASVNLNTGDAVVAVSGSVYPCVAWQNSEGEIVNMIENAAAPCADIVNWAMQAGFIPDIESSSSLAMGVEGGGECFVPAFAGMQVPFEDPTAGGLMMGITAHSTPQAMAKATLDSIVFIAYSLVRRMRERVKRDLGFIT